MQKTCILNNTPIRTSVSYKINDITMKDLYLPEGAKEFKSYNLNYENLEVIEEKKEINKLIYGVGEVLEKSMSVCNNSSYIISTSEEEGKFFLDYTFDDNNDELSNYIEINADKDIIATVIFRSNTEKACYHNFIIKNNISNGAKVHVEIVNLLSEETNHFLSIENHIEEDSKLELIIVDMGAKNSISNMYSNLVGKKSEVVTKSIYIGQNKTLKDMNYIVHLRGKKSVADMDLQGVLTEQSKKFLKFTIDFKTGCTGAIGSENESCMLLSDEAVYRALPILLCTEDDVEGAHSAAAGQVDKGQLFYIMSRGFDKKEATKMLVKAKYNEIIEMLYSEELRKEILEQVDRRL